MHLVLGQPLICSLFSLLFSWFPCSNVHKFEPLWSCCRAARSDNFKRCHFKVSSLDYLTIHLHLCGTWSQAWYGHFLISSSLKFRTVSTVVSSFFFPSYHHHPCFMGEIRRSKRSNRSQSECSSNSWEVTPCPFTLPIHAAFWHVSLSWLPPQLLDPRRWLPVETGTRHVFPGWCPGLCHCSWRVSQDAPRYSRREHLGRVWIL